MRKQLSIRSAAAGIALVLQLWLSAPAAVAAPGGNGPGGGPAAETLELEIGPGNAPARTGLPHVIELQVRRPNGNGVNGVAVDVEIVAGPGDDDLGTPGDTPEMPDASCTTDGGSGTKPGTCEIAYVEQDNEGGSDALRAWIDADGLDSTVEADRQESENQHAVGSDGCQAGGKGPGLHAEPDATDCVERRWMARVAAVVDVQAERETALAGATTVFAALVFDQFGDAFAGPGRSTTVSLELLGGSIHDGGAGDFSVPDVGSCSIGETNQCSVSFTSRIGGVDRFCAYVPGESGACGEAVDAAERDNGADVVERSWASPPVNDVPAPSAPSVPGPVIRKPVGPIERDAGQDEGKRRRDRSPKPTPDSGGAPGLDGDAAPLPDGGVNHRPRPGVLEVAQPAASRPARAKAGVAGNARARRRPRREAGGRVGGDRGIRVIADGAPGSPDAAAAAALPRHAGSRRPVVRRNRLERRLAELSQAAARTAESYSFPLGLTLMVVAFLAVQSQIDRRDPKLRLAPVDSKHDLSNFV